MIFYIDSRSYFVLWDQLFQLIIIILVFVTNLLYEFKQSCLKKFSFL